MIDPLGGSGCWLACAADLHRFLFTKIAAPLHAAEERVVASLMQISIAHPEHDVPRAMTTIAVIALGLSCSGWVILTCMRDAMVQQSQ